MIRHLIGNNNFCGVKQTRENINYLHPGFIVINNILLSEGTKEKINFSPSTINGTLVDTGGLFSYFLNWNNVKELNIENMNISFNKKISFRTLYD